MLRTSLILLILFSSSACSRLLCDYNIEKKSVPFNSHLVSVSVSKNCGLTTVPIKSYYLLPASKTKYVSSRWPYIRNKYRVLKHERGAIAFEWVSLTSLIVKYDFRLKFGRQPKFLERNEKVGDVEISYEETKLY